ncbi:e3 ubiquitin-protein ligase bre1 [Anaeramoeba flamelloides]|uniref:E3 ubiquitin protein ligase n=1 Tax=Anaeramoeba flamelloides TaxID=1746091 RepID=A0AAV7YVW5_9EUKA|nr:e3 ubiquitin-protein ligase bre1 [Anaeramoeba flamelloides]
MITRESLKRVKIYYNRDYRLFIATQNRFNRIQEAYHEVKKRLKENLQVQESENIKFLRNDEKYSIINNSVTRTLRKMGSERIFSHKKQRQIQLKEYKTLYTCSVCMVRPKEVVLTTCFHSFCKECINERLKLVKNLKFREQKFENINWQSDTLKELEFELEKYRIKQPENSPSWKVQKYLKIISIQNNINKQQRYLKWEGSTSILKLRNFTNYLNRYSYVMNKDKSKYCKICKKSKKIDIIEDLDHFLWNCPAYENNRKIWISELKKFNISDILKNNILTIFDIIRKRDSSYLLALVGNKFIFESLTKFLNHNLGIR